MSTRASECESTHRSVVDEQVEVLVRLLKAGSGLLDALLAAEVQLREQSIVRERKNHRRHAAWYLEERDASVWLSPLQLLHRGSATLFVAASQDHRGSARSQTTCCLESKPRVRPSTQRRLASHVRHLVIPDGLASMAAHGSTEYAETRGRL